MAVAYTITLLDIFISLKILKVLLQREWSFQSNIFSKISSPKLFIDTWNLSSLSQHLTVRRRRYKTISVIALAEGTQQYLADVNGMDTTALDVFLTANYTIGLDNNLLNFLQRVDGRIDWYFWYCKFRMSQVGRWNMRKKILKIWENFTASFLSLSPLTCPWSIKTQFIFNFSATSLSWIASPTMTISSSLYGRSFINFILFNFLCILIINLSIFKNISLIVRRNPI